MIGKEVEKTWDVIWRDVVGWLPALFFGFYICKDSLGEAQTTRDVTSLVLSSHGYPSHGYSRKVVLLT